MNLKTYLATLDIRDRENFAEAAGTTVGHLKQLSGGHRRASPDLAKRLVAASQKFGVRPLTLSGLRPDIWTPRMKLVGSEASVR